MGMKRFFLLKVVSCFPRTFSSHVCCDRRVIPDLFPLNYSRCQNSLLSFFFWVWKWMLMTIEEKRSVWICVTVWICPFHSVDYSPFVTWRSHSLWSPSLLCWRFTLYCWMFLVRLLRTFLFVSSSLSGTKGMISCRDFPSPSLEWERERLQSVSSWYELPYSLSYKYWQDWEM